MDDQELRAILIEGGMTPEGADWMLRNFEALDGIPEIASEKEYLERKATFHLVNKLIEEDDSESPLGVYSTTLLARILEWEGR